MLKNQSSKFKFYSLALDESTDATNKDQIPIFIYGVDIVFNVTEELRVLYPLTETTKSQDSLEAAVPTLNQFAQF